MVTMTHDSDHSNNNALLTINAAYNDLDDLVDLESTVDHAKCRYDQLLAQLAQSQSKVDILVADTKISAEECLYSAQELSLLRHTLSDDISTLSGELVSSMSREHGQATLLEDLETMHRNLKELESVRAYVEVIESVLKLSESAIKQIHSHDPSAAITSAQLTEYQALHDLVDNLSQACSNVEDDGSQNSLHLLKLSKSIRVKTWMGIKGSLSAALLTAAEKLQWPMPVDYVSAHADDRKQFQRTFLNLLALQYLGSKMRSAKEFSQSDSDGLYPLQALVLPLNLRFKYHFDGDRQTNRLDKPEWYFTHVLNVVHEHRSFMESIIQRMITSTEFRSINAWNEFTSLLLPLLSRKIKRTMPALLPHPPLLAHTIYEALAFDAALIDEGFTLSGISTSKDTAEWYGISDIILGKREWFEAWIEGEKKFAEDQYEDIINSPSAWLIAEDGGAEENSMDRELKSTNSARQIKALVEQVKDRYSTLPQFHHRMQFLTSVQLPLLEYYHERISSSLDAFETLSSAFARTMPGTLGVSLGGNHEGGVNVDASRLTNGVEGVQRLYKALVSAKYIAWAMGTWGEDLFFLELWTEICRQPSLRAVAQANPLLPGSTVLGENPPENTIFEEFIKRYEKLVSRSEDMIVQLVCREVETGLRSHFAALISPNPKADEDNDIALSQDLLAPIALLSSHLTFLHSTLPQITTATLYRRITSQLADHILQREIIFRGKRQISLVHGKALLAECELWIETCHMALNGVARARVERPWSRLYQAGKMVGAEGETWERLLELTFGGASNEEWENGMVDAIGGSELSREEAARALRSREDCDQ